jgi:beta-1,4-mannosyltransferase
MSVVSQKREADWRRDRPESAPQTVTAQGLARRGPITVGSWPGRSFHHNPFIGQFCSSLEAAGAQVLDVDPSRPLPSMDVLHIHWPDWNFWMAWSPRNAAKRCALTLWRIARAKLAGLRVVWMVHDLRPLQGGQGDSLTWHIYIAVLARLPDGFMTLSAETVAPVKAAYPPLARLPFAAPNHPLYEVPAAANQISARATLDLPSSAIVFTFFGLIRPTKGVLSLVEAFIATPGAERRLIIAGEPKDADYMARIRSAAAGDPRIIIREGHVSDADAALIGAASDAYVLPFCESLHSGSIIYALSIGRPVITPDAPYARGVHQAVGSGWVTCYRGALTPAVLETWRPPTRPAKLDAFSASRLGEAAMELYARVLGRTGSA